MPTGQKFKQTSPKVFIDWTTWLACAKRLEVFFGTWPVTRQGQPPISFEEGSHTAIATKSNWKLRKVGHVERPSSSSKAMGNPSLSNDCSQTSWEFSGSQPARVSGAVTLSNGLPHQAVTHLQWFNYWGKSAVGCVIPQLLSYSPVRIVQRKAPSNYLS